jgi:hypothetical protein
MQITKDNAFFYVLQDLKQQSKGQDLLFPDNLTEEEVNFLDAALEEAIDLSCAELVHIDTYPGKNGIPGLILVEPRITKKGITQLALMELLHQGAN